MTDEMPRAWDATSWALTSSNGYFALRGLPVARRSISTDDRSVLHDLRIEYHLRGLDEPRTSVAIDRIPLSSACLDELRQVLRDFVELPLERLRDANIEFSIDLGANNRHKVVIGFGKQCDVETGPDGIGCRIDVEVDSVVIGATLVTDVTCLSALLDGLELAARSESS